MRDTDDIGFACVPSPVVMNFHCNAKGGAPIEPEELGEWGVPRSGMIGRSREREGGRQRAAAIAAHTRAQGAAPYSAFADVYDFLIGDLAFPALQRAFRDSVRRFGLEFRTLADVGWHGTLSRRVVPAAGRPDRRRSLAFHSCAGAPAAGGMSGAAAAAGYPCAIVAASR